MTDRKRDPNNVTSGNRSGIFSLPPDGIRIESFATLIWVNDPYALAEGYFDAAQAIVRAAVRGECNVNTIAAPLLFVCRHWIEVQLKAILGETNTKDDISPSRSRSKNQHDLLEPWKRVREYAERRWPGQPLPGSSFDEIGATISLLARIDPISTGFRYGDDAANIDEDWLKSLVPTGLDLSVVATQLDSIRLSLQAVADALHEE